MLTAIEAELAHAKKKHPQKIESGLVFLNLIYKQCRDFARARTQEEAAREVRQIIVLCIRYLEGT